MRSILLMANKNIKKKKLQNILIAIMISVSAIILTTGIGLLQGLDGPVNKMFKLTNASHDVLFFNENLYDSAKLKEWFLKQPNIAGITQFNAYSMNSKITIHDKKIDKSIRVVERPSTQLLQDKLLFVEGEESNSPKKGEVWIPTSFAYSNNLKVGDVINLPTNSGDKPLRISAIVVDPASSSSLMGTVQLWVGTNEIQNIFNSKSNTSILGVQYKDLSESDNTWKSFETYLNAPFGGYRFAYSSIKYSYEVLFKISASVLIAFSLIVMLCVILVIAFTISNSILGDFKLIGILKSQGFKSKQIQYIYQMQFLILSVVATPIGVILGSLCVNLIMSSMLKATGINGTNSGKFIIVLLTFLIIFTVIIITTLLSSKKVCKIKPSEALRSGASDKISAGSNKINITNFKNLSCSFSLAVKQMFSYKRQVLFVGITLFLTSLVFSGTINSYNSILKLGSNLAYWGFDNSDITVQFNSGADSTFKNNVISDIKDDSAVDEVIPWFWSSCAYKTPKDTSKTIELLVYDGNMNSIGITNIRGKSPVTAEEVSLAVNTSKDMNKDIGDSVDLYFNGIKKSFLVTGIYQSMVDGGTGARLQKKGIEQYLTSQVETMYAVKLKSGEKGSSYIKDLGSKYNKEIDIKQTSEVFGSFISTIIDNMSYAILFLIAVFVIITFIIIFNVTLITIYQQKKDIGILKSIGMFNKQIRATIVFNKLLSSLIGITLGIPAGIIILPRLLSILLSGIGIINFPFLITFIGTIGMIVLCIFIVCLSVWIASKKILQIKLTSLLNE